MAGHLDHGLYGELPKPEASAARVADILDANPRAYDPDPRTAALDLVADVMHFCDAHGLAWADVEESAAMHHGAEVAGLD